MQVALYHGAMAVALRPGRQNAVQSEQIPSVADDVGSCTTRPLDGLSGGLYRGLPVDGVYWQTNEQNLYCGDTLKCTTNIPVNLTKCIHRVDEQTYRVDYTIGPFVSHGGMDWWIIDFRMDSPSRHMIGITGYSVTNH